MASACCFGIQSRVSLFSSPRVCKSTNTPRVAPRVCGGGNRVGAALPRSMTSPNGRRLPRASSGDSSNNACAASGAPSLTDSEKQYLRDEAVSWAAQHGLLVATDGATVGAAMASNFTHAPISLLPTPFPKDVFATAIAVSPRFAELSDLVSRDHEFLVEQLTGVLETDDFTAALWDVYLQSGGQAGRNEIELGILRSDYMLDVPSGNPLQVEVNTVSTSFMALSTRVTQMHRHLVTHSKTLATHYAAETADETGDFFEAALPSNVALEKAAETLAAGHLAAGDQDAKLLMVCQPNEKNVFDQRLVAHLLWEKHGVRVTRATLAEMDAHAELSTDGDDLMYHNEKHSVVYFRAGYAPGDYPSDKEWRARLLIEKSTAVKSPSVAMQLAGCKKIQQALAGPGVLERFVARFENEQHRGVDTSTAMRSTFAGLYALDGEAGGVEAVADAIVEPQKFVLKPQREGGGNNLYGDDMVGVLKTFDPSAKPGQKGNLSQYILMQRIFPPTNKTLCLRAGEMVYLETLSELGVYGGYVRVGDQIIRNEIGGHLLRTKAATSDEGGVAAGYAVLDSPKLE